MNLPEKVEDLIAGKARRCHREGCSAFPSYMLNINVWSIDTPANRRNPSNCIKMAFGLHSCAEHRYTVKADEFFLPESRKMIKDALKAVGKAPPDLDAAVFEWKLIGDTRKAMQGE